MVDLTYDAIKGQEEKAPIFVKRNPVKADAPDWTQHSIIVTTSIGSHSIVVEVLEDSFFIKKLEEEIP